MSKTINKDILKGEFTGDESGQRIVLLNDGLFYILAPIGSILDELWETDTISFGNWVIDRNLLVLNSFENIYGQYLPVEVKEAYRKPSDTVTLIIDNPYEQDLKKQILAVNKKAFYNARPFYYAVSFDTDNIAFATRSSSLRGGRVIKYSKKENVNIRSIAITIIPDNFNYTGYLPYKLIYTIPYVLHYSGSNYFEVKIPEFTSAYLNHKRLKGEYIKILGKDKLLWNNEIYQK